MTQNQNKVSKKLKESETIIKKFQKLKESERTDKIVRRRQKYVVIHCV